MLYSAMSYKENDIMRLIIMKEYKFKRRIPYTRSCIRCNELHKTWAKGYRTVCKRCHKGVNKVKVSLE